MDKNARYSLLSLGVLAVAAVFFGYFGITGKNQISASSLQTGVVVDHSIPLKVGENTLQNGAWTITKDSLVIAINNNLVSIPEAQQKGVLGDVKIDGAILNQSTGQILPNKRFTIIVLDSTKLIQFLPQEIK
jgi:hypothetical protein